MPDVRLVKPAVGVPQNIVCEPQSRFIFDFPMDAATLSRVDDHLVLTFDDGSTIRLENFYTAYSGENMPSFSVDGAEISGQDFFTAMNEPDLMPAAGPTAQVADGAGFREYENMALLDGLDRLGGLDIGFDNGAVLPDLEEGGVSGLGGVTTEYYDAVDIDHPVIVTPGNPGELGDIPVIDNLDNPHDGNAGAAAGLVPVILDFTAGVLRGQEDRSVALRGQVRLLHQPEYQDVEKAQEVLSTLDEETISQLPAMMGGEKTQILVGPEQVAQELKDTSVVMTKFDIGEGMQGLIGVVGPTRMDYAKVTARLSYFAENLSKMFSRPEPNRKQLPQGSAPEDETKEA